MELPQKGLRVFSRSAEAILKLNCHQIPPPHISSQPPLCKARQLLMWPQSVETRRQGDKVVKVVSPCVTHHTQGKIQDTHINLQLPEQQPKFCFDYICIAFNSFPVPRPADVPLHTLCLQDPPEDQIRGNEEV